MLNAEQRLALAIALRDKKPVFYRDADDIFHQCTRVQFGYVQQDEEPEDAEDVVWLRTKTDGIVRCAALDNVAPSDFFNSVPLFAA
ncbi:hypothetical protein [Ralstonia sp. ASV6]|uniref:hypothetical protein n=1 Tax=Ralstonia sp. ASV6 TaxID=2795124 RepID=UPI0018EB8746|nr:hypothetical protein [Ralstonia sp. ASV6]